MKKTKDIENLVSGSDDSFMESAKTEQEFAQTRQMSTEIAFMLIDFMEEQEPVMKQKDLAKQLGVSAQYLGKVLHGETNFQIQTLEKIATVLELSLSEFLIEVSKRMSQTEGILYMDPAAVRLRTTRRVYDLSRQNVRKKKRNRSLSQIKSIQYQTV